VSGDPIEAHWGLTRMPFGASIPTDRLSRPKSHQEAVARVRWAVAQREACVIAGEVGSGKTVAARAALAGLEPARHLPIYVPDPTQGLKAVHHRVVEALGGRPHHSGAQMAAEASRLLAGELDERGRLPVLVIDEAHLMGNQQLEGIRMLTNTEMDTGAAFSLVLLGQPTLRRRLRMAVLSALDQRVATRYTIAPMAPAETAQYAKDHLAWAGRTDTLFSDDAIAAIHQASRGYPRAVNALARAAMVAAYTASKAIIDASSAEAAIADMTE
jgi:type II secretory pathway predicted ATPase ExeA